MKAISALKTLPKSEVIFYVVSMLIIISAFTYGLTR
jgi:hypothetical protein